MIAYSLYPNKIPILLGNRIGGRADGEVFHIQNEPDKVVKFCVKFGSYDDYLMTRNVIKYIIDNKTRPYVNVYEHQYLGLYGNEDQKFILHYYIMQKLNEISEDEMRVFSSFLSQEYDVVKKDFTIEKVVEILRDLKRSIDFDFTKVKTFCEMIKQSPISHKDLHVGNVMTNNTGDFYLIDLDRCEIGEANS